MLFPALTRFVLTAIAVGLAGAPAAQASFVSTSPDPFPPGSGFIQAPGCIAGGPLSGVCASNVAATILASSSSFAGGNELVALNERVAGDISFMGVLLGDFSVLGTLSLTLADRAGPFELGTFSGTVTAEDYSGAFDGIPLEITLDPSQTSTTTVTITPLRSNQNQPPLFLIDSSFDISSEISIDGGVPIPIGGFPITGVAIPEPASMAMFGAGLFGLCMIRRKRVR